MKEIQNFRLYFLTGVNIIFSEEITIFTEFYKRKQFYRSLSKTNYNEC